MFVSVSDAFSKAEGSVELRGWIYRIRKLSGKVFIMLRDSSGVIQCVVAEDAVGADKLKLADSLGVESSITLKGTLSPDARAPGGFEVKVKSFEVVHAADRFPITKDKSESFLLDTRHLWLRSQKLTKVLKVRFFLMKYAREWFEKNKFWEVEPPILTTVGAEGGSTLFDLKYFDSKAYLGQTAQLYNEAFITSLEKVFVFAPSFRAEKSRTTRHLTEYWHLEEEAAWVDNEGNIKIQEELISYLCQQLAKNHADLIKDFRDPKELLKVKAPFNRMTYDEAIAKLQEMGFKVKWGIDPGTKEEKALTDGLDKPLVITGYPKEIKAFYMRTDPENPKTVLCNDMLAPDGHGEIVGGSERIWDKDELLAGLKRHKLNPKDYEWYLDLRRFGSVPHSGFGLGIERLTKWILNLDHIRDALAIPRLINRVYP